MRDDSRQSMVRAAAALFRERGYAATSFQDVIARSGAPRGSIYHHFPGGKEQLAIAALKWYSDRATAAIRDNSENSIDTVNGYLNGMRETLRRTDFRAGCPIAGVALDLAEGDDALHEAVADAFALFRRVLANALETDGATPAQARRLSSFIFAALEGALMLARAERDMRPIDDVGKELIDYLQGRLG